MNVIDKAIDRLIAGGKLNQEGDYGDIYGDGPVCMYGAIAVVTGRSGLAVHLDLAEGDVLSDTVWDELGRGAVDFNDDPATSLEDAVLMMKKASAKWDEANG